MSKKARAKKAKTKSPKSPKVTAPPAKRARSAAAKPKASAAKPRLATLIRGKAPPLKSLAELGPAVRHEAQPTRKPSQIKVGKRFRVAGPRKDAHVAAIAASIDARGMLLEPIVVDTQDKLIDGECRLLAWSKSKFAGQPIPVHVVAIDDLVAGEYDANAIREDFSPTELVAIKRAIEQKLGDAARERGRAGVKATGEKGRVGDVVAAIGGKGRRTIEKAEAVVEAAERDPARFGKLQDDMNRTGRVDGPYKRLQNIQRGDELRAAPPPAPMRGPYHTVAIDLPWPADLDGHRDTETRGYYPYATMSLAALEAFARDEILPVLAPDCAVWLWIPNFHLVNGCQLPILKALGAKPSTKLTWCKPEIGQGQRLRGADEVAVLAIRGTVPVLGTEQRTWFEAPAADAKHSAKPAEFFRIVEQVTPAPRYAYFFAPGAVPEGWDGHGDRVGNAALITESPQLGGLTKPIAKAAPAKSDAAALPTLDAGDKSTPEDVLACLDGVAQGRARETLLPLTAIDYMRGAGWIKGKHPPKLTKFGEKHLARLRDLARGKRAAADDAFGGHIVAMTIDWTAGPDNANLKLGKLGISVGTCKCGAEFRVPRGATPEANVEAGHRMEALIAAHRREVGADRHAQLAPQPDPHPEEAAPGAAVSKDEAEAAPGNPSFETRPAGAPQDEEEQEALPGFLRRNENNEVPA